MTFSSDALTGRVALMTGGGTGIGFGIASEFAKSGAKVVLASRNLENLCNTIAPGPIGDTEGVRRIYEDQRRVERERSSVPFGVLGKVHDIAQATLCLCSDTGAYVNGCDLVVDGGRNRSRAGLAVTGQSHATETQP